jgi:hypothetical protein
LTKPLKFQIQFSATAKATRKVTPARTWRRSKAARAIAGGAIDPCAWRASAAMSGSGRRTNAPYA